LKTILIFFLLITGQIYLFAQTKDMQKQIEEARKKMEQLQKNPQFKQAMQKAQEAMKKVKSDPEIQKAMAANKTQLDSMKKTNPALANVVLPDLNSMQIPAMPNFDSIGKVMDKASAQFQTYSKTMDQEVPKLNAFHHAEKLHQLSESELLSLVNGILKKIKPAFNPVDLNNLNAMLKDTSIYAPGTGAFLLATGGSTNAALFLICNGILKNSSNPWAINDLGVYYRNQMDYETALECYFYANKINKERNSAINTNIGWAAAYYGDFDDAEKYFEKALAIDNNFTSAIEGEALLAYQKGDIAALLKCLAKEIKFMGISGGSGPSVAFGELCGGIISENNTGNLDNQSTDPNEDHTFDNPNPNDGQDPPPGADVDDITYPRYKKIFINDAKDIWKTIGECSLQGMQSMKELKQRSFQVSQKLKTLKPLVQTPYRDDEGNLVYPNSFSKYVQLFDVIDQSFEKRTAWYISQLEKKLNPLREDVVNRDMDMNMQYNNALLACGKLPDGDPKDACIREVNCKWIPKMYKSKNNDLDVVAKLWDDYYTHTAKAIQWYIDASAPFISRVHEEGWNEYLNLKREFAVRKAIISAYGRWGEALGDILSPICAFIGAKVPSCAPVEVAGVAPDPFSKKPKHIKEFEGPCFDVPVNSLGIGLTADINCHATTIGFEAGPFKAFYTHVDDPIYAQNHEYTNEVGTTISASKDVAIVKLEGNNAEKSIVSAGAGVEGSVDLKFDNNWNFTSGSSSISASANVGGINMGGISATRTVEMVAGQLHVNPLSVTTTAPLQ
jgi:tetratricopeptide (TPR) repeat protein